MHTEETPEYNSFPPFFTRSRCYLWNYRCKAPIWAPPAPPVMNKRASRARIWSEHHTRWIATHARGSQTAGHLMNGGSCIRIISWMEDNRSRIKDDLGSSHSKLHTPGTHARGSQPGGHLMNGGSQTRTITQRIRDRNEESVSGPHCLPRQGILKQVVISWMVVAWSWSLLPSL